VKANKTHRYISQNCGNSYLPVAHQSTCSANSTNAAQHKLNHHTTSQLLKTSITKTNA